MLVYQGVKQEFIDDVNLNKITDKIYEKYKEYFGNTSKSQIRAWKNSMQYMRGVLDDKDIPNDSGVAIEFNIPSTSKRIDFILSGKDETNYGSVIVIELKQWDFCNAVSYKDGIVSTYVGNAIREVAHPSYQAMSYANLIRDFNKTVQEDNINLYPCAFLHNYDLKNNDPICSEQYKEYINEAPMFGSNDFDKLRSFIKRYIKKGDNRELLFKIENGKIRPSKRLQDSLVKMLSGNKEFNMIDEQKVFYEEALTLANRAIKEDKKIVYVVQGGPGTGKSVLAINLLVELLNRHLTTFYVTKNSAPREVFSERLRGNFKASYIKNLFISSGSFTNSKNNEFDCLIVDEAHRLNAKSGLYQNIGENQIKEIIKAARFSIFFIDEDQRVTLKDIGSLNEITKYVEELHTEYYEVELASQFRCNGSNGYLSWVDNTLQIRETANFNYLDFDYDIKVFDNPNDLRKLIEEKNRYNNKSRIVAGYCWQWLSEGKNDTNIHDIKIPEYNFEMSWNLNNSKTWAIDPLSVKEAGCIHTCQGLEFDYVGVIIGDDIRFKDGKIITDYTKRAKSDKSLHGIGKLIEEKGRDYAYKTADLLIKNTYRTLMTRGMKGCYIYCTNKELSKYFKEKIKLVKSNIKDN